MSDFFTAAVEQLNLFLWGPVMIALMVGVGVYFTLFTRFFQITHFKTVLKNTIGSLFSKSNKNKPETKSSITPFQAVSTALAGTVGTGNIAGVATALTAGGPGAIVWMCISAFFGMMTKYAEVVLAVKYRNVNQHGEYSGGPMYYIENGLKLKPMAIIFALLCIMSSFGIGNITQSNSISDVINTVFNIPHWLCGLLLATLCGVVLIGGVNRISKVSEIIVPFMAVFYVLGAIVFLCINAGQIPSTLKLIFSSAFNLKSAAGGVAGYTVRQALQYGVARGVFTNEAGMGSAPIAHASADTNDPVSQGMWGIFEVFLDTIVICTLTTLVILTAKGGTLWNSGLDGAQLTTAAFSSVFGSFGAVFIAISILFFAFATILGWAFYGQKALDYISGGNENLILAYKIFYILLIFAGAMINIKFVWSIADALNGLMAIPNLIAILFLSGVVFKLTKEHK